MNWGKGIVIGMSLFVLFIASLGGYMLTQPDDYDKQYYEKGLAFDQEYAKEKQVITDHATPSVSLSGDFLVVRFKSPATGKLRLVRPSDRRLDRSVNLHTDTENIDQISAAQLTPGQWQLVFEWKSNGKEYLYKHEMFIP